jgi:hypothetical protein
MRRPQVLSIANDFLVQGAEENHAHEKKFIKIVIESIGYFFASRTFFRRKMSDFASD